MSKSFYHRQTCRLCESKNVEMVVPLAPIPLPDKYVTKDQLNKPFELFPVDLYMCHDCGHVQLLDVINPDVLWDRDFSYHSGQTPGIIEHFEDITEKIVCRYNPAANSLIFDVGSNDGSMLQCFKKRGFRVLGIDPAKEIAQKATDAGIETLPEMFTPDLARKIKEKYGPASVIMAFNVFAHADDMSGMAESIHHLLAPEGVFLFEVQYLMDIIDHMLLGTIFHEHLCHHSVKPMMQFLRRHGMELIDVERVTIQRGSIIGTAQLIGGPRPVSPSVERLLALEKERGLDRPETIKQFANRLAQLKQQAQGLIAQWKRDGATVAAYGAARSGPTFIAQLGLGDVISFIVDDHPQKVHKYSPGHRIPVIPTEELYKRMPDYVVILAWIHAKKIIAANRKYLEQGGHFVVCCPEVQVIGQKQAAFL